MDEKMKNALDRYSRIVTGSGLRFEKLTKAGSNTPRYGIVGANSGEVLAILLSADDTSETYTIAS